MTAAHLGEGLAVATHGLRKAYGRTVALDGLDLAVPRGVVYGFLGPNGAGTTTTIRCLLGLIHPDAGTMDLLGRSYSGHDRRRLFDVGSLIESPSFYPYLSGRENLNVIASTGPAPGKGRIDEVLELVDLTGRARDRVQGYSLGMRQRLGIGAALLNDPQLLILDEPANGLDPAGIHALRATLRRLVEGGDRTIVVSSHILPEVQLMADVVGIINHGHLVYEGALDQLLHRSGSVRARVQAADVPAAVTALAGLAGTDAVTVQPVDDEAEPERWIEARIPADRARDANRVLAEAGIYASGLAAGSDLESIFLELTGGPLASIGEGAGAPPPVGGGR
ncbi:MAG TPA: ABC transporter ATP-binding protein [Candidatus Limnocylindrales bacterium]|nr:ABC transporter ATP-binding protein [Candidatus Limnocylindrales bacterium]